MQNLQDIVIIDIPSGNCAVCRDEDGLVVNTIVAIPDDPTPRPGFYLIGIELNTPVTEGCKWNGTNFLDSEGNVLKPDVPETKCAVVDPNSIVTNLALAQINKPFVYENNTLVPLVDEEIVGIGFYWSGSDFTLPSNNNKLVLKLEKSDKTPEFLNGIIQGEITELNPPPIPYGFVKAIDLGESFDLVEVSDVLNSFSVGQKISNTNSFESCPMIIDVIQEPNNG
jgi:hypothetical protein